MSDLICPRFQAAADLLGRRWSGLVVQALLAGPVQFSALASRLDRVGPRMLAVRLRDLEAEGVVERRVMSDRRVEYRLTRKGKALGRVMQALGRWAEQWVDLPHGRAHS
ncbi:MAG: helix-turn-helix domain-containing protein [Myxococcales bacterium]